MDYSDVVCIYGMARAMFIPQLFSLRLPSSIVVYELLAEAGARALVYDQKATNAVTDFSTLTTYGAPSLVDFRNSAADPLPPLRTPESMEELVFIFHTSGSTSGRPKLVPCNAGYVDSIVYKSYQTNMPATSRSQDVCTWM